MTDVAEVAKELPLRYQEEPFVAYKRVDLRYNHGVVTLRGSWSEVSLDDHAKCKKNPKPEPEHDAPFPGCDCGFWGLKDKITPGIYCRVVATVEMFGTVIHGEKGYRSSRQRILQIAIAPGCGACEAMEDVRRVADGLYFDVTGAPHPLCVDHGSLAASINAAIRLTPSEIAARIGTEVMWSR